MAIGISGYCQEVINPISGLNSGGIVYDVEYIPHWNMYAVVGDFSYNHPSLSGTRYNLMFLNADLTISDNANLNSITSINGAITSVEYHSYAPPMTLPLHYIYVGGEFTSYTRGATTTNINGISKIQLLNTFGSGVKTLNILSWDPEIDEPSVYDLEMFGDSIAIGGFFFEVSDGSGGTETRDGLVAYNANNNTLLPNYDFVNSSYSDPFTWIMDIETGPEGLFISTGPGQIDYIKHDGPDESGSFGTGIYTITSLDDDYLIVTADGCCSGPDPNATRVLSKTTLADIPGNPMNSIGQSLSLATYKDFVFTLDIDGLRFFNQASSSLLLEYPLVGSSGLELDDYTGVDNFKSNLIVCNNILFMTFPDLISVNGSSQTTLGAVCIEPADAADFTSFDLTICPGDTINYEIPDAQYADGYRWEFSGTGVDIGNFAPGDIDSLVLEEGPSSLDIEFLEHFTEGVLTVTPYSNCGGNLVDATNKQYSESVSIFITTNPLPNISSLPDTTLTCKRDSILLSGSSTTPSVTYTWLTPGITPDVTGTDTIATTDGNYIFQVTDLLGCSSYDTVLITMDTIKPDVILPVGPFEITCKDSIVTLLASTSISDSLIYWEELATDDIYTNPAPANTIGTWRVYVEDTINGCIKDAPIFIVPNDDAPNVMVSGYPDLALGTYLDSINCYVPSLLLSATSDTPNTIYNWCDEDTTNLIGVDTLIEAGGWYNIFVEDTLNGCTNFGKVLIYEDFNEPDISIDPVTSLNCSNDSLILNASSVVGDTIIWSGPIISPSSNPVTIFDASKYYATSVDSLNGCEGIDSIDITLDSTIDIILSNDTIVCNGDMVLFDADYIGSISGITYEWNNGETSASALFTGGSDSLAVVEIFGDGGCYGIDSIRFGIPPEPSIELTPFQPCGDGASGQIVVEPISGWGPFTYSIDEGLTYQTESVFNNLDFGNYIIWTKDSLGCDYSFETSIDQSAAVAEPEFLVSTYNMASDTLVIVDISNPPTDSTSWVFPSEVEIIDENPLTPVIVIPDTGSYELTMIAYYGTCEVLYTKTVYASDFDTSAATNYNKNGIKNVLLYPNPTNGNFTIEVTFHKSQRSAISVQDMLGYTYEFFTYEEGDLIIENIIMDGTAVNGTYIVKIVGEYDSRHITFILNK